MKIDILSFLIASSSIFIICYFSNLIKRTKTTLKFFSSELADVSQKEKLYPYIRNIDSSFVTYGSGYNSIPLDWKNTIFETHRAIINGISWITLEKLEERLKSSNSWNRTAVLCTMVIPFEDKYRLVLEDPYGKVISNPICISHADEYLDKLCTVVYNLVEVNEIYIRSIQSTNMGKYIDVNDSSFLPLPIANFSASGNSI